MTNNIAAESVSLSDDGVEINWSDGHKSVYEGKYLRINCGCAECVEEWSRRQLLDAASVPADIKAEDYLMVGRYAVQFLWSDAHFTGIYPFDILRKLCPCDECRRLPPKKRDDGDAFLKARFQVFFLGELQVQIDGERSAGEGTGFTHFVP